MFNPLPVMAVFANPNYWIRVGTQLLRATPILIPIYGFLLGALHSIPIRNPNADLERLALLQQQLAFVTTIDLYLIASLVWRYLRG